MNRREISTAMSRFTFFQVSSCFMILGINLSFFLFINVLIVVIRGGWEKTFAKFSWLRLSIILFLVGSLLCTLQTLVVGDETAFMNSLRVLPNYIFWGIMMLLFAYLGESRLQGYRNIFIGISGGVILSTFYYVLVNDPLSNSSFLKKFTPNNFSFILICFTPYLMFTLRKKVHWTIAIAVFYTLLYLQISEGRRAGAVLVFFGGLTGYLFEFLKARSTYQVAGSIVAAAAVLLMLSTSVSENLIRSNSERIHGMIYDSGSVEFSEDRSRLVRKAMLEKGFILFRENVFFGAGLNNFTKIDVAIDGNFEGAKYVIDKDIYRSISSHNAYVNFLAEGGLVLGIPTAMILVRIVWTALRRVRSLKEPEKIILLSFLLMCVHLFFINGLVNSLAWFNIGLLIMLVSRPRRSNVRRKIRSSKSGDREPNPPEMSLAV